MLQRTNITASTLGPPLSLCQVQCRNRIDTQVDRLANQSYHFAWLTRAASKACLSPKAEATMKYPARVPWSANWLSSTRAPLGQEPFLQPPLLATGVFPRPRNTMAFPASRLSSHRCAGSHHAISPRIAPVQYLHTTAIFGYHALLTFAAPSVAAAIKRGGSRCLLLRRAKDSLPPGDWC